MIDRASILAWSEHAPWSEPFMIEQDLIICKALVCIFGDKFVVTCYNADFNNVISGIYLRVFVVWEIFFVIING